MIREVIQTATYVRPFAKVTLTWFDVDEVEFTTVGDVDDQTLLTLASGNGREVEGWERTNLS